MIAAAHCRSRGYASKGWIAVVGENFCATNMEFKGNEAVPKPTQENKTKENIGQEAIHMPTATKTLFIQKLTSWRRFR